MPKVKIFEWDLFKAVDYQPRCVPPDKMPKVHVVTVIMESKNEKVFDVIDADPLLHQRIVDLCLNTFREAAGKLRAWMQTLDASPKLAWETPAVLAGQVQGKWNAVILEHQAIFAEKWKELVKSLIAERKEYDEYFNGVVLQAAIGAVGGVASVLGVAAAAVTGGGLPLAIIGLWRSVVDTWKLVHASWMTAEEAGRQFAKRLETMKLHKREWTGAVLNPVIRSVVPVIPTVTTDFSNLASAKSDLELWRGKLCHLRDDAHALARRLNEVLNRTRELDSQYWHKVFVVDQENAARFPGGVDAARTKAEKTYRRMKEQTIKYLEQIPKLHQRAEEGLKAADQMKLALEELKAGSSRWPERFEKGWGLLMNLGMVAGGQADNVGGLVKGFNLISAVAEAEATLADVTSTALQIKEVKA